MLNKVKGPAAYLYYLKWLVRASWPTCRRVRLLQAGSSACDGNVSLAAYMARADLQLSLVIDTGDKALL